ncbi:hypothetical protein P7K49_038868 [Saguinus oedipus]|uniref:Transcription elongation factor A protein-like 5 n=1 Tax=Saguinus oedipus TaxID=9490 RepID=A0ABQ9THG7_SAGOE|nr:hypothetical protein P7K49_038868 [Saguinus oedipus]
MATNPSPHVDPCGRDVRGQRPERVQDWILFTPFPMLIHLVQEMEGLVRGGEVGAELERGQGLRIGYQLGTPRKRATWRPLMEEEEDREKDSDKTARKRPDPCRAAEGGRSLQERQRGEHLNMEKLCKEHEGKPENERNLESEEKPEDEESTEEEGKSDEEEKPDVEGKTECEGKREDEGEPGDEGQLEDEGSQEKQGKSEGEGKPQGEGKPASQAKPESQPRAAEKRPAEDYVPRKAKRKTDRGTDDSPKDSQEDLQGRHLSSEEMMRECGDVSRAQEELRKKQKMGGFHWMQRDVQDPFAPRGQRGVRGMRGGGRGQKDFEDVPYV